QNIVSAKSIVNVLWSLPFELQMYLFLPLLFFWTRRRQGFWPLIGSWPLAVIMACVQPHLKLLQHFSILRFLPNFLPGVIAFVLPIRQQLKSFLWTCFIVVIVRIYDAWPKDAVGWILCLVLGLLIPSFKEMTATPIRFIAGRIATYSYGIYLSHQFCIWLAFTVCSKLATWQKAT